MYNITNNYSDLSQIIITHHAYDFMNLLIISIRNFVNFATNMYKYQNSEIIMQVIRSCTTIIAVK